MKKRTALKKLKRLRVKVQQDHHGQTVDRQALREFHRLRSRLDPWEHKERKTDAT